MRFTAYYISFFVVNDRCFFLDFWPDIKEGKYGRVDWQIMTRDLIDKSFRELKILTDDWKTVTRWPDICTENWYWDLQNKTSLFPKASSGVMKKGWNFGPASLYAKMFLKMNRNVYAMFWLSVSLAATLGQPFPCCMWNSKLLVQWCTLMTRAK